MGKVIRKIPNALPILCSGKVDYRCPFLKVNKKIPWLRQCTRSLIIKAITTKFEENAMLSGCCGKVAGELKNKFRPVVLQYREKKDERD